jgi:hypothetical protein
MSLVAVSPEPAMFVPWSLSPVPLMKTLPAKALPPDLVTMFICGPPVVDSPRPPKSVNTTSWALPTSGT